MDLIVGLHHVTACVDGAQEDIDFYTKIVGQKMVKQTVLLDGERAVYHFYYGDAQGNPGTLNTSFPFRGRRYGRRGSGQIKATTYSVPAGSLEFWHERMVRLRVPHDDPTKRFGQRCLRFGHPSGIEVEVIEDDRDQRSPWVVAEIGYDHAVRGIHSVALSLRETADSEHFMHELGFRKTAQDGPWTRFEVGDGGPGRTVDFLHEPDLPSGTWTYAGKTYNHVAFNVSSEADHQVIKTHLDGWGYVDMSEIKDRNYFRSSYIRMPGGVLFEFCTSDPRGFAKDEPADHLGHQLLLPAWKEDRRDEILADLEPIAVDAVPA